MLFHSTTEVRHDLTGCAGESRRQAREREIFDAAAAVCRSVRTRLQSIRPAGPAELHCYAEHGVCLTTTAKTTTTSGNLPSVVVVVRHQQQVPEPNMLRA